MLFDRKLLIRFLPFDEGVFKLGPSVNWRVLSLSLSEEMVGEGKSARARSDGESATAGGGYASKSIAAWRLLAPSTDEFRCGRGGTAEFA